MGAVRERIRHLVWTSATRSDLLTYVAPGRVGFRASIFRSGLSGRARSVLAGGAILGNFVRELALGDALGIDPFRKALDVA